MTTDPFTQSEYLEVISSMFHNEFGKDVIISRLHNIKSGDGNTLFYVITGEGYRFILDITGKKVENDSLLYWIENIDHAGKICELFYARDEIVLTFRRGAEYNNEYLSFLYSYGHSYPAIRFVPESLYQKYSKMMERNMKKYSVELPEDLMVDKN